MHQGITFQVDLKLVCRIDERFVIALAIALGYYMLLMFPLSEIEEVLEDLYDLHE